MTDVLSIATDGYLSNRHPLSIATDGYIHLPVGKEEVVVVKPFGAGGGGSPSYYERLRIKLERDEAIHRDDEEIIQIVLELLSRS